MSNEPVCGDGSDLSEGLLSWDQQSTLCPPPYKGAMAKNIPGLTIGDALVDQLPSSVVSPCHNGPKKHISASRQLGEPAWVDFKQVARGQALWDKHLARAFLSLSCALINGFSIARFAKVLCYAGYAQSPKTAFERYIDTGFYVLDWFISPLDNPDSDARQGVYTVRYMHSFARRQCTRLFDANKGEGIAISQYDLGEVLLGFTAVVFYFMEKYLHVRLSCAEKEDMVATWRLIGYHLGIKDEFNVCSSLERMDACFKDYMEWTPLRFSTCREDTHVLQRTVVCGFGKYLGVGERSYEALTHDIAIPRGVPVKQIFTKVRAPLVGMPMQALYGVLFYEWPNTLVSAAIRRARDHYRKFGKKWIRRRMRFVSWIAAFNDTLTWRCVCLLNRLARHWRVVVIVLLLGMIARARR